MIIRRVLVLVFSFIFRKSYAKIKPIIKGGDYTSIKEYPHSANLQVVTMDEDGDEVTARCCASILNQDILLTAAHCVCKAEEIIKLQVFAIVGYSNITGREKRRVSGIRMHESFDNEGGSPGDIAVLKLENPLTFSETVNRVAIMKSPPYSGPASIAGWGLIDDAFTSTDHLKHLRGLEVLTREECMDRHKLDEDILPKGVLCSGYYTKSSEGQTQGGDSGGALIVQDYIQIGLTSGEYLDLSSKPKRIVNLTYSPEKEYDYAFIYTDVGFYYDWILENVMEFYCENYSSIL